MREESILLVPADPRHVPAPDRIDAALRLAERRFPQAARVVQESSPGIRFHDCGAMFEALYCPACGASLELEWWDDAMDADHADDGFRLGPLAMPCCGRSFTLDELRYEWPQAFGRFALTVGRIGADALSAAELAGFERELGCALRVVRQRL